MDTASLKTVETTKTTTETRTGTKPPSLHSKNSWTTLATETTVTEETTKAAAEKEDKQPDRYTYYKKTGRGPNPDAQPKPKSKVSKFLSKFQSPAVKQTNAAREREQLEEERRGVKIYTPSGTPAGSMQSTAAFM